MNEQTPQHTIENLVIEKTVEFAIQRPAHASDRPPALLIALHGYGQSCDRFIRVFAPLRRKNILVVAPQAPNEFYVKMDPRIVGFTWLTRHERDRSIAEFVVYMQRLLEKTTALCPYDPERVSFLGFSQGVSMAYRFAVSGAHKTDGVVACGADLPPDVVEKLAQATPFRVLLAHGTEDTVVPLAKAKQAQAILRRHSWPVEPFFFPGGHEISPEAVEKIGDWMIAK